MFEKGATKTKAILVNDDRSLRWDHVPDPVMKRDEVEGIPLNREIPDLSHHRAYRSVHGGSTNLTSNTPFGVVVCHRD